MIETQRQEFQAAPVSPRTRIKMLEQMVGALETELSDLCRRATAFDEEESLLERALGKHHAEVERLGSRLNSVRSERQIILSRIESLTGDALAIRDEVSNNEVEMALDALHEPARSVVASGSRARRVTNGRGRRWRDSM